MSDKAAASHPRMEVEEIGKRYSRQYGVEHIDDGELKALCGTIRHVLHRELGAVVNDIYVMGSFACGEARGQISDLDLRVLIQSPVPEAERKACEKMLREEYSPTAAPSICGYLDPHVTVLVPNDAEPHVEVSNQ